MNSKEVGLPLAEMFADYIDGQYLWRGEAHGEVANFVTNDPDLKLYVSPIFTMREKGVALVDENGYMRVNRRRDR